ncbi:hypothetical protein Tco_1046499 [Tanacetum coccineum]
MFMPSHPSHPLGRTLSNALSHSLLQILSFDVHLTIDLHGLAVDGFCEWHLLQHLPFQDGSESHNRNLRAILTNGVVSCSTLSDVGYAEDFYDQ